MKYHVFELEPSGEMGVPLFPLIISHQVSKGQFLDYNKSELKQIIFQDIFLNKLVGTSTGDKTEVYLVKGKDGGLTLFYVKITGRVLFCKEVKNLVEEIKEVEKILKDCICPLEMTGEYLIETSRESLDAYKRTMVDKIRNRLCFRTVSESPLTFIYKEIPPTP